MSDMLNRPKLSKHIWLIYSLAVILLGFIWYFEWIIGAILTVLLVLSFYYSIKVEKELSVETEEYISTLSYRVKKVGEEALLEMPIGIVLFNEEYKVEWTNHYIHKVTEVEKIVGESLNIISENLLPQIKEKEEEEEFHIPINNYEFRVILKKDERLLYLFDRTEQADLEKLYFNDQTVLFFIFLDNYDEITQNMEDTIKSQLNSEVTAFLNQWAHDNGLYLKRTSQDRFLAVGTKEILNHLEQTKFDILDDMHELNSELDIPVTLSIGIGVGNASLPELGHLAQSSLDLALGRGGDQVAIKDDTGKVRFYGGKTNPMEKRTRVRARVISHALRDLVRASDRVIIMGHQAPDMDAIGSAIGILNIAQTNGVDGYIVFDPNDVSTGVYRLVEAIKAEPSIWQHFIDPESAEDLVTSRTLIVIVDTHKPSMVVSKRILNKSEYRVVIDHHRRAEEFIENPTLVYMEPYASSTAELVTELLEYQPKGKKLKMLEATALLAGIIVDTKSFTLRTGSRTFDAASYLRAKGADTILVQQFLKEDLNLYIKRSKLIERASIYRNTIAITKADAGDVFGPVLIAQTADTLLTMTGISASFVIAERNDGKIGISARSLGEINVQIIMEQMNGGGHLTNAATQLEDTTIDETEALLKDILDEYYEGRESE
ncbi:DHH family phosphoesterase [Ornithinibacillus halotolerans]|uniref:Cyclic-di-AMP phosphodiesterase n=1 Tax=Ornithinibacillus halotolerans TaxID=1274357 RepID=A0A916RWW8_9BACI|nr:DHH family phosphoesterase [Ornithinibacillus halotolerans]GGA70256.1 cyclic-di-AMP phosphodiesterase GdpP [Ornithinibacillus halotolerans]